MNPLDLKYDPAHYDLKDLYPEWYSPAPHHSGCECGECTYAHRVCECLRCEKFRIKNTSILLKNPK